MLSMRRIPEASRPPKAPARGCKEEERGGSVHAYRQHFSESTHSADNVHRQSEGELVSSVPSTEVVGDSRQVASFGDSQEEANSDGRSEALDESGAQGEETEGDSQEGQPDESSGQQLISFMQPTFAT